jgi:hypothetical protein
MNSAYNKDMGFQGGPFHSGDGLCHPINEKEYYNTNYSKQSFSGNGGASKVSKSKKVLVVEATKGKGITRRYITEKEADKHMKERHIRENKPMTKKEVDKHMKERHVRYDKPMTKKEVDKHMKERHVRYDKPMTKKGKKGGNASENYASFLEGSYSPYNSSYKQEKCGGGKMHGGGDMSDRNADLTTGMNNMSGVMGVAKQVTSGGGCGCGSSLNSELTKDSMYNGVGSPYEKFGGKLNKKNKKLRGGSSSEEAGSEEAGSQEAGASYDQDQSAVNEQAGSEEAGSEQTNQEGGKNRRKIKGGVNYAGTFTEDDKVSNQVFNRLDGQLNGGKNNRKHRGGNDSAGVGSDFALTLASRGPANYPDAKSADLFRFFNKTSEFIPNSELKYAAAPISTGYSPDQNPYPLAYNDDSDFIGGESNNCSLVGGKNLRNPATKKPTAKKPATKKPASKKPATKKPAAKKLAAKKPATKKPATKKPATKKPVA